MTQRTVRHDPQPLVNQGGGPTACKISLRCPSCDLQAAVDWGVLGRALDCPGCACRFVVLRDGKAVPLDSLPQVAFSCPRCQAAGTVAGPCAVRGAVCRSCRLPLALGPDGRLHGVPEALRLNRDAEARQGLVLRLGRRRIDLLRNARGERSLPRVAAAGAVALLPLLVLLPIALDWLDNSPERSAERLVRLCLANRPTRAEAYLEDDPVQQVEFERWRLRRLASLRDDFRPVGDRATVRVATKEASATARTLAVTLQSPSIGSRSWEMVWRSIDGAWVFDVVGTLAKEDAHRPPGRTTPRARTIPGRRPISPGLVPAAL